MQIQSSSFFAENGGVKSWVGAGQGRRRLQQLGGEVECTIGAGPDVLVAIAFLLTHTHMHTQLHAHTRTFTHISIWFIFILFCSFCSFSLLTSFFAPYFGVVFTFVLFIFSAFFWGWQQPQAPCPAIPYPDLARIMDRGGRHGHGLMRDCMERRRSRGRERGRHREKGALHLPNCPPRVYLSIIFLSFSVLLYFPSTFLHIFGLY